MKQLYYLFFFITSIHSAIHAQGEWLTNYEEGLEEARITGKYMLLELGTNSYGTPLFIYDEVWQDTIVQLELNNYVPVSLEITDVSSLPERLDIQFLPAIFVLDSNERVLYKDSGRKDEYEMIDILNFIQYKNSKNNELSLLYGDTFDKFGTIIYAENCIHQSMLAPDVMRRYYGEKADFLLKLIEANKSHLTDQLKQRYSILANAHAIISKFDLSKTRKLYKIGQKDLKAKNHALLLYFLTIAEEYDGDSEKAKAIYGELTKLRDKDTQAVEYSYNLQKMFDIE